MCFVSRHHREKKGRKREEKKGLSPPPSLTLAFYFALAPEGGWKQRPTQREKRKGKEGGRGTPKRRWLLSLQDRD